MRHRLLLVALLLAASGPPAAGQPQAGQPHGPSHALEMNRRWLAPDVDVEAWARRFEDPAREVIASRPAIVSALRLAPGQTVADIGAGTGAFLRPLSEAVGPQGRVLAVDISAPFAAFMAARAGREGLSNVTVIVGRGDDPTLGPDSVDAVLTVNTFHHFEAPEAMLAAIRRALRPGGQLAVVDFDRGRAGAGRGPAGMALDRAEIVRLAEAAGFRLIEEVPIPTLRSNVMLRFRRP